MFLLNFFLKYLVARPAQISETKLRLARLDRPEQSRNELFILFGDY